MLAWAFNKLLLPQIETKTKISKSSNKIFLYISRGVRHYFHTMLVYCLITHFTAIYHFCRVPKMLPNKRFESGRGIFNGNTSIFRRHSGWLLLPFLPLLFFSFSFFRFWQARCSKGATLPPQVTNRSLDSSEILSSVMPRDLARLHP